MDIKLDRYHSTVPVLNMLICFIVIYTDYQYWHSMLQEIIKLKLHGCKTIK